MPYTSLAHSTFLDAFGANLFTQDQYNLLLAGSDAPLTQLLQNGSDVPPVHHASRSITVGLVLDRANEPTALLSGNWAERQAALSAFASPDALWATYGADPALYTATRDQIKQVVGHAALETPESRGHLSTAADRTIWVTLDAAQFEHLFGRPLLEVGGALAWTGQLGINDTIAPNVIKGLGKASVTPT